MKLWKIGVLGIAAALFLNGCGKDCKDKIINPSMEDITAVSEVETTKNFTKNTYTGIDIRNKGEITNETGDVSRIGMNMYQSRINDKDFYFNDVAVRDGKMIVAYSLVTRVYNEGEKENNHNYGMDIYEIHIAVINIKNKEIIKDFVPGKEFLNVVFDRGGIRCLKNCYGGTEGTYYDYSLNKLFDFKCNYDNQGYFSENGCRIYYFERNKICMYNPENGSVSNVKPNNKMLITAINGVFTDMNSIDYVSVSGIGTDLKSYNGIFRTDTGEFIYLNRYTGTDVYFDTTSGNGIIWEERKDSSDIHNWKVYLPDDKICNIRYSGETQDIYFKVLDNGDIFFYGYNGEYVEMTLFDGYNYKCKGITRLDIRTMFDDAVNGYLISQVEPVYLNDNGIMIVLSDGNSGNYYFEWDITRNSEYNVNIEIYGADEDFPSVASMAELYDPELFVPGKLSDGLLPLNDRVKDIVDKYNIKISIGEECSNIIGGYAIRALTDYDYVNNALDILDEELSKYPEGFVGQIGYGNYDTIHFYIAADLIGISSETLNTAGGFQLEIGNESVIVVDFTYFTVARTTIHHELGHCIDDTLTYNGYMDENIWNSYNPLSVTGGSIYTDTYDLYGNYGDEIYAYGSNGEDCANSYFVDTYSMTYPSEDRAKIWENIMSDEKYVYWEKTPHLTAKLNYYAECIRQNFDSTGWNDVRWEKYMNK